MGWEAGAASAAYLAIRVEPDLVTELLGKQERSHSVVLRAELGCEDPVLTSAARGIAAEIQDQSPLGTLLVESYVGIMFAQLLRLQRSTPATPRSGGLSPAKLSRVMARIEEDLDADMSLSKLSDLAGLSIPQFCRAFKESVGVAPYTFILKIRLARAKEFLRHSEMSVTDIALTCGFSSSSHFANIFRREVGMTPAAFRAL
jgi:AraC-like DNA-binding protein